MRVLVSSVGVGVSLEPLRGGCKYWRRVAGGLEGEE
jgi:hypothetical protein